MDHPDFSFNNDQFRDLFDHATDLIHFSSPEGRILYINPAWSKTLGYSMSDLKDSSIYEIVHPEFRQPFKTFRERVIATGVEESITIVLKSSSGKRVMVEASISCKYEKNVPLYTRGILRDVTRRMENEEKVRFFTESLQQSEEYTNQLLMNAPDAVIVIDEKSNIIYWNRKSEQLFGWKAMEIMGKALSETIIPHQYRQSHLTGMQRLLHTGVEKVLNKTIEITALNKQQTEFPISLTISRSLKKNQHVFISFIRDISEQKRIESELHERRLELEKSNLELEQYASLTSHDLKEPLRKILFFSDLLISRHKKSLPEEATIYIDKIHTVAGYMNELVEAVLNYSKINIAEQQWEVVDLNLTISRAIQNLEVDIQQKKAILEIDPLPSMAGNQLQLIQLFQNLISNSLKYTAEGITPHIMVKYSGNINGMEKIMVRDNGIGFENEYAELIFGIFERLENRSSSPGTGIGLAICKKIVEAHHGAISAESSPGKGATFFIEFHAIA